jgi:hypothetical protein
MMSKDAHRIATNSKEDCVSEAYQSTQPEAYIQSNCGKCKNDSTGSKRYCERLIIEEGPNGYRE